MVELRPHVLKYKRKGIPAQKNNENHWVEAIPGEEVEVDCKYERNSEAKTINNNDGKDVLFTGTVFIDKEKDLIPAGSEVVVYDKQSEVVILKTKVIQSVKGRLLSHFIYI